MIARCFLFSWWVIFRRVAVVDAQLPRPPFGHKLRQVVLKKCSEGNFVAEFWCSFFAQADWKYWPWYQWPVAEGNCKSIRVIWHNLTLAQYFAIVFIFMGNQSISVLKKYFCSQNTFSLCCFVVPSWITLC